MVKRQTTKDLLAASLRELTEKMPFERITIKDIVQNCGVSSTTFYHHFSDKYQLVEWIYQNDSGQFVDQISDSYTWKDAALHTVLTFHNEIDYYRNYFRSDSSAGNLNMITYAEALNTIKKLHGEECITDEVRFCLQLYLNGVTIMTVEWILNENTDVCPECFINRIMDAMPDMLRSLLF